MCGERTHSERHEHLVGECVITRRRVEAGQQEGASPNSVYTGSAALSITSILTTLSHGLQQQLSHARSAVSGVRRAACEVALLARVCVGVRGGVRTFT
jgi:hypothetical protein